MNKPSHAKRDPLRYFFLSKGWLLAGILFSCASYIGIYHLVEPGQTLYRIALTYGVSLSELMRINRIQDPTQLKPGTRIFIPGARSPQKVPPSVLSEGDHRTPKPASRALSVPIPTTKTSSSEPATSLFSPSLKEKHPPPSPSQTELQLIWPIFGTVSRGFSLGKDDPHEGIDIDAPSGTPVRAAEEGRVLYSDNRIRGYGNMVIIRHHGRWATIYAHNEKNLVREGDFVRQGQIIARVGATGRATGSHLHFEVRYGKDPCDPLRFLPETKAERLGSTP